MTREDRRFRQARREILLATHEVGFQGRLDGGADGPEIQPSPLCNILSYNDNTLPVSGGDIAMVMLCLNMFHLQRSVLEVISVNCLLDKVTTLRSDIALRICASPPAG
jgi:hypothetical protein